MERDHDGFSRGVKTILQSKAGWRSGICGVVGELLHVEGRYVTAIETALGGALQNIITRDAQTAKEAIRHLKIQKEGGRLFCPLIPSGPAAFPLRKRSPQGTWYHRPCLKSRFGRCGPYAGRGFSSGTGSCG